MLKPWYLEDSRLQYIHISNPNSPSHSSQVYMTARSYPYGNISSCFINYEWQSRALVVGLRGLSILSLTSQLGLCYTSSFFPAKYHTNIGRNRLINPPPWAFICTCRGEMAPLTNPVRHVCVCVCVCVRVNTYFLLLK